MDLETLRLFIAVARRGGFATVARDREVDPSSVSRTIAALEAELGVRLFQRNTRHLSLTEAGARYLGRVEAAVDQIAEAREDARGLSVDPSGTLRLTASVAFSQHCLVPLLPAFRSAYPAVGVELLATDANLDLIAERVDLAIRLGPAPAADLVGTKLFDTTYRVVASPGYAAGAGLRAPADLAGADCLLFLQPEMRARWMFRDAAGTEHAVPVSGSLIASGPLALYAWARAGLGPALLPDWLTAGCMAAGALVDLFPSYRVAGSSFETAAWLLYPARRHLPQKVRVAIDFLGPLLRERPA